nr:hypothetical protein [Vibrio parahaemolyticus]
MSVSVFVKKAHVLKINLGFFALINQVFTVAGGAVSVAQFPAEMTVIVPLKCDSGAAESVFAAILDVFHQAARSDGGGLVVEMISADLNLIGILYGDGSKALRPLQSTAVQILVGFVGTVFVAKRNTAAYITNAAQLMCACRIIFLVVIGDVVVFADVRDSIARPLIHIALAWQFDPSVGGDPILVDGAIGAPHFKVGRT